MNVGEEYYLKQKIMRQQRQLEGLQKDLKNSTRIKEGMLTERERFVLHFGCMITSARITGIEHPEEIITKFMVEVARERCRSLSQENVAEIVEEIEGEMQATSVVIKHLNDETEWQVTGVHPDNNSKCFWEDEKLSGRHGHISDWSDMK